MYREMPYHRSNFQQAEQLANSCSERDIQQAQVYALLAIAEEICHLAVAMSTTRAA